MNSIIKSFLTVIPMFVIYFSVYFQLEFKEWKTKRVRQIVSGILAVSWPLAFGMFCGYTGFLRG